MSIGVGIAAAVVQVIGLLRWPLIVPSLADDDDTDTFDTVHDVLGTVVGETFGYLLTAAWTCPHHFRPRQASRGPLVLVAWVHGRGTNRRWGSCAADVPGADFLNFVGYILWSVWMLIFATLIVRRPERIENPEATLT